MSELDEPLENGSEEGDRPYRRGKVDGCVLFIFVAALLPIPIVALFLLAPVAGTVGSFLIPAIALYLVYRWGGREVLLGFLIGFAVIAVIGGGGCALIISSLYQL